jgi:hypothetical protein
MDNTDERIELTNTLAGVEGSTCLYLSLWMHGLQDASQYVDVWPQRAVHNLEVNEYPEPIPVMCDLATKTYLRDRHVQYMPQLYRNDSNETRLRIRAVSVSRRPTGSDAVQMGLHDFLERFLAEHHMGGSDAGSESDDASGDDDTKGKRRK